MYPVGGPADTSLPQRHVLRPESLFSITHCCGLGSIHETEKTRHLAVHSLLAASLIAVQAPATKAPLNLACSTAVRQQLDGLYRWQVQRMNQPDGPTATLSSQRERFTTELFILLMKARQLTPTRDGRFLDFDVFSNTQVRTFGAVVTGCNAARDNSIRAAVEVQVGLRNRASETPRRLEYDLKRDSTGQWRIDAITYRDEPVFQLRPFLDKLLNPSP